MKLIFLGDKFYEESKTILSPIVHEDGRRSDWGKVQCALRSGETVSIRPATQAELRRAERELARIQASF